MKKSKRSYVVLIFGLLIPVLGAAAPFDNIYVLGDSLSDQGNLYVATLPGGPGSVPCPSSDPQCLVLSNANTGLPANDHYYQGRFSNGPVYTDILAQRLGLTLTPSSSSDRNNFNFAYGGARTNYNVVESTAPVPSPGPFPQGGAPWTLDLERQAFQARNIHDSNGLYIVWSGSNDIGDLILPVATHALTFSQAVAQMQNVVWPGIESVIEDFVAAGAQDILVPNIPDLGKTPDLLTYPLQVQQLATLLASTYNSYLKTMLDTFTGMVNIHYFDTFSLMGDVIKNPSLYGFTNVTTACYSGFVVPDSTATVCSDPPFNENPSSYAFWDSEHPTTVFHEILANRFYQAVVPEPSVLMNFLLGLGVLAAVGRTRLLRRHRAVECVSRA